MLKIAPSLVSAPMTHLAETVKKLEKAGADILHFDIEDGDFVPMMSLGVNIIKALRPLTDLPFDVHLMVNHPEWLIPILADFGTNMLSVHFEACPYPRRTLGLIYEAGMQAGLAFNPKTALPTLSYYSPFLDFVLVLTTEPEARESTYLPEVLEKVSQGKKQPGIDNVQWEVDGGFNADNIQDAQRVQADIVVAGRGVFLGQQYAENIRKMKQS